MDGDLNNLSKDRDGASVIIAVQPTKDGIELKILKDLFPESGDAKREISVVRSIYLSLTNLPFDAVEYEVDSIAIDLGLYVREPKEEGGGKRPTFVIVGPLARIIKVLEAKGFIAV